LKLIQALHEVFDPWYANALWANVLHSHCFIVST